MVVCKKKSAGAFGVQVSLFVLAKDESWSSFLGVNSHDSLGGINFYQFGKLAEPPTNS